MRVMRLLFASFAACTIAACSDTTEPVPNVRSGAGDAGPHLDGGYLGNGGRSDTTSTTPTSTGGVGK
jgi:hypothetical protein